MRFSAFFLLLVLASTGCKQPREKDFYLARFDRYIQAVKDKDSLQWELATDTVKRWMDAKKGEPALIIRGKPKTGPWAAWDSVMGSSTRMADSAWFVPEDRSVQGYFSENNDFYTLLGKPPTKTLRTYWFNEEDKIHEILIYWIPEENVPTSEYLKAVKAWARGEDSLLLQKLYLNDRIIPSAENALKWKALLLRYRAQQKTNP